MRNNIYLTDEEKSIIIDFMSCAIGEGYNGGGEFDKNTIEEKLIVISDKLGFTKEDIGL